MHQTHQLLFKLESDALVNEQSEAVLYDEQREVVFEEERETVFLPEQAEIDNEAEFPDYIKPDVSDEERIQLLPKDNTSSLYSYLFLKCSKLLLDTSHGVAVGAVNFMMLAYLVRLIDTPTNIPQSLAYQIPFHCLWSIAATVYFFRSYLTPISLTELKPWRQSILLGQSKDRLKLYHQTIDQVLKKIKNRKWIFYSRKGIKATNSFLDGIFILGIFNIGQNLSGHEIGTLKHQIIAATLGSSFNVFTYFLKERTADKVRVIGTSEALDYYQEIKLPTTKEYKKLKIALAYALKTLGYMPRNSWWIGLLIDIINLTPSGKNKALELSVFLALNLGLSLILATESVFQEVLVQARQALTLRELKRLYSESITKNRISYPENTIKKISTAKEEPMLPNGLLGFIGNNFSDTNFYLGLIEVIIESILGIMGVYNFYSKIAEEEQVSELTPNIILLALFIFGSINIVYYLMEGNRSYIQDKLDQQLKSYYEVRHTEEVLETVRINLHPESSYSFYQPLSAEYRAHSVAVNEC